MVDGVVTILELSTEKMNMHTRHENDLNKMLSQLSTESSKQTNVSNVSMVSTSIFDSSGEEWDRSQRAPRGNLVPPGVGGGD